MKLIFFSIIILAISGIGIASSQILLDENVKAEQIIIKKDTTIKETFEQVLIKDMPKQKKFDIKNITDGSIITSVDLTVSVNGDINKLCFLTLIDPVLDDIQVSDEFTCSGIIPVTLNDVGNFALENNIRYSDNIILGVKDKTGKILDSVVSINTVNYKAQTYFAKVENGIVTNVIIADSIFVNNMVENDVTWIETKMDNSIRGNYAGVGYNYDSINDVFYPPQQYPSWSLDENWDWQPPTQKPNDGDFYFWNESKLIWERP